MDGKEVSKMAAYGSSPTSKTLTKLGDALNMLHQAAGDSKSNASLVRYFKKTTYPPVPYVDSPAK